MSDFTHTHLGHSLEAKHKGKSNLNPEVREIAINFDRHHDKQMWLYEVVPILCLEMQ